MAPVESLIRIRELHPTFGAEILGADFSRPVGDEVFAEILEAIIKYGVCVFRNAQLDDTRHVQFAARFGELDDIKPYIQAGRKNRFPYDELFDVSNIEDDGSLTPVDSVRSKYNKGNTIFHVDSSFNPRRAGYSLLRAHELPPKGTGGQTEFADTRQAYDDLPEELKQELLEKNYVVKHSMWHSRKLTEPEYFKDWDPEAHFMSRHRLIQRHETSGRMNLYIASHAHHIEGVSPEKSKELLDMLYKHAQQPKYVLSVEWEANGDLVLWDNTCVMHRATGGSFEGKYKRDMRRATVHDGSIHAWGLNPHIEARTGYP